MSNLFTKTIIMVISLSLLTVHCVQKKNESSQAKRDSKEDINIEHITHLKTLDELKEVLERDQDKLIVVDLYADWCMPCKILAPVLKELAKTHKGKATFYKVNVQTSPEIASVFNVRGVPFVVFIKEKEVVHALIGLNPKEKYEEVIKNCGSTTSASECKARLEKLL